MLDEIYLFPGKAPGSEHLHIEEVRFDEPWEGGKIKSIVQGVTAPSVIPFLPEQPNGTAVIVIPGGAYRRQVLNLEGTEIAEWLNSFGITAFVLKHRMPGDAHTEPLDAPLQDIQRAIRLIRSRAAEFGVDPDKLGVMGFSAGGHLASTAGTCYDVQAYEPIDEVDRFSARPSFMALCYPCISARGWGEEVLKAPPRKDALADLILKYGTDDRVNGDTPVTFIMVADDDTVTPAEHSVNFYLALRRAGVSAELHAYRYGQHGFGLGTDRGPVRGWTDAFRGWLETVTL